MDSSESSHTSLCHRPLFHKPTQPGYQHALRSHASVGTGNTRARPNLQGCLTNSGKVRTTILASKMGGRALQASATPSCMQGNPAARKESPNSDLLSICIEKKRAANGVKCKKYVTTTCVRICNGLQQTAMAHLHRSLRFFVDPSARQIIFCCWNCGSVASAHTLGTLRLSCFRIL